MIATSEAKSPIDEVVALWAYPPQNILVNYDLAFETFSFLLDTGITSERFPAKEYEKGSRELILRVFSFPKTLHSGEVGEVMATRFFRPATARESFAYIATMSPDAETASRIPLVALGSVWQCPKGSKQVVGFMRVMKIGVPPFGYDYQAYLDCLVRPFPRFYYFLGVEELLEAT